MNKLSSIKATIELITNNPDLVIYLGFLMFIATPFLKALAPCIWAIRKPKD